MIKIAFSILSILFFLNKSFFSCTKKNYQGIQSINVSYNIPIIRSDGIIIENKNSFNVYYWEDLIMYQFRSSFDSSYKDSLITIEYRDNFFVFSKGSIYGYNYEPYNRLRDNKLLSVDSMLEKHAFQKFQFHLIDSSKRISKHFDSVNQNLKEVFTSEDPTTKDTIYFYYTSNLNDIDFSFSKKLDSIKKMKLHRILIINGRRYYPEQKISIPERQISFELTKIPVQNPELILSYFNKFKSTIKKNK